VKEKKHENLRLLGREPDPEVENYEAEVSIIQLHELELGFTDLTVTCLSLYH